MAKRISVYLNPHFLRNFIFTPDCAEYIRLSSGQNDIVKKKGNMAVNKELDSKKNNNKVKTKYFRKM